MLGWCAASLLVWGVSAAWAGDGAVALQTADPACPDDSGKRYVDCGNGTVTDNDTGLVWLKQANCLARCSISIELCTMDSDCPGSETCVPKEVDWFTAMEIVAGLSDLPGDADDCGLEDGSSPGEWRLPSKAEWEAMVAGAVALGCSPTITNDSGDDCWDEACVNAGACSFTGVEEPTYWSSNSKLLGPSDAWVMFTIPGSAGTDAKTDFGYLWPVRGGQ